MDVTVGPTAELSGYCKKKRCGEKLLNLQIGKEEPRRKSGCFSCVF